MCTAMCIQAGQESTENGFLAAPEGAAPTRQRREFASIVRRYLSHHLPGGPEPQCRPVRKKGGSQSKNYEICLRLNEAQAQKLRQDAKACGLSKTAYLRRLIEGAELKARPSQELRQLRTEIHHIGNNVNQLARKFNAGFGTKGDAQQVRYLMEQIYDLLYEIAKE